MTKMRRGTALRMSVRGTATLTCNAVSTPRHWIVLKLTGVLSEMGCFSADRGATHCDASTARSAASGAAESASRNLEQGGQFN